MVHYFFFSLAGPRDKQVVFAIRAELGLTPQMDVGPYAYGSRGGPGGTCSRPYIGPTALCLCYFGSKSYFADVHMAKVYYSFP